jgi:NAD(P)-dependent dehydrogenase (short-subunit alcohol dehydrogenase family)
VKELTEATGQKCAFSQVDVRQPASLNEAVKKCIETFGRIDYVICGMALTSCVFPGSLELTYGGNKVLLETSWRRFLAFQKMPLKLYSKLTP